MCKDLGVLLHKEVTMETKVDTVSTLNDFKWGAVKQRVKEEQKYDRIKKY